MKYTREYLEAGQRIAELTKYGISPNMAEKLIAMPAEALQNSIAKFGPMANKTAMQEGLVKAAQAELDRRAL